MDILPDIFQVTMEVMVIHWTLLKTLLLIFSEAVYNYVPNFKDTLWKMFKVRAEINRNNALKRNADDMEGQNGTSLVVSS